MLRWFRQAPLRPAGAAAIAALATALPAQQDTTMFASSLVTVDGHRYPYRLLPPERPAADGQSPLVVYLHGAGERGDDNERQLHWLPRTLAEPANRTAYPCFLLALQCPANERWVDVPWDARESTPMPTRPSLALQAVVKAIRQVQREHHIDATRIYLTGLSMGGYGAFDLACRHPDWFAAVAPICGGGDERQAHRLVGVPFWVWHGDADQAVPVARSRTMVEALRNADGEVRYSELAGVGHDSWKQAYGKNGVLDWLFAQRRPLPEVAPFVPWPRQLVALPEAAPLVVGKTLRVAAADPDALPHAQRFAGELRALTGAEATVGDDGLAAIVLAIDRSLPAGGYRLDLGAATRVTGADRHGLAAGTAALLQALQPAAGVYTAPACQLRDAPAYPFRALLVDCARHFQSPATLRRLVVLCRLYRVPFLVLHLSDHEAFRFPSQRFPEVTSAEHYALDELRELVGFAEAAGVTLVPELDVPGHSRALVRGRRDVFGLHAAAQNDGIVNLGRSSTLLALEQLLGELASVFAPSPWIHIGGDEVDLGGVDQDPDCQQRLRELGGDAHDLYRDFLVRMHGAVRRLGRRTLVWEGFGPGGKVAMPKDLTVIAWETSYQPPDRLAAAGYELVNASWRPLYVVGGGSLTPHGAPRRWSAAEIYRWHPRRWEHFVPGMPSFGGLELGAAAPVRGAMMCVWEQRDGTAVVHLRERLPAFAERCWHPDSGRSLADFAARAARADALAQVLLGPGADGDADDHADDHADEWAALQRSGPARVRCRLYAAPPAGFETVPDFAALTPYATGTLPLLRGGPTAGPLGLVLTATLRIETAGEHWFRLESCDGLARLWLGDQLVCEQTRRSDWQGVEAKVALTVGDVPLRIDCAQGVFHTLCRVQWRPPGAAGFTLVDPALRVLE